MAQAKHPQLRDPRYLTTKMKSQDLAGVDWRLRGCHRELSQNGGKAWLGYRGGNIGYISESSCCSPRSQLEPKAQSPSEHEGIQISIHLVLVGLGLDGCMSKE